MKKTVCVLSGILIFLALATPAHSLTINDPWGPGAGELNLKDIWNAVLNDSFAGSSMDLYNTYGVGRDNPELEWWWNQDETVIEAEVRYAGNAQSFGYRTKDGLEVTLADSIPMGITGTSLVFQPPKGAAFTWFERWDSGCSQGQWYANTLLNEDGKDHFVAFEVPASLFSDSDSFRLYMLAFEDLSMGDADYQDLVLFARTAAPAPVPEPGTLGLLGIGLMGLGILKRKYFSRN
ncbi:MAG TPA: PEP-CTERM sorting domain-containing protein [Deltaproteobacteria bacterium]|jgi:hypothetical protein|nr:PEP-CTERM sorting domain-containing protein [Deltaproteobacteria bacterium]HOI06734.1 PEP-CTERM sorting domain-containing protein [Deltaproteobacteria bacterium]